MSLSQGRVAEARTRPSPGSSLVHRLLLVLALALISSLAPVAAAPGRSQKTVGSSEAARPPDVVGSNGVRPAGQRRTRLRVRPSAGPVGSRVRVRGVHFPAGRKVRIRFAGRRMRGGRTNRLGKFSRRLHVPTVPSGRYRLRVRAGAVARSFRFTVTAGPARAKPFSGGITYYLDSERGSDSNPGTSKDRAWRSLSRASGAPLAPGDRLLLRRGAVWTGGLKISRSGADGAPITVSSYGNGALPRIGGACVELSGSNLVLREVHVDGCAWAGIAVSGDDDRVERSLASHNVAGVSVHPGASSTVVIANRLRDNNRMSVLTPGGSDDSGAFGILLHGERTEVAYNTISGSDAFSYDYRRDGAAIEVYGGGKNRIHHNRAIDNLAFSELGRSANNTYAYNVVRSSLESARFLITVGSKSGFGPVLATRLHNNSVRLSGGSSQGVVCHRGCSSQVLSMRNNVIQAVAKAAYADAPLDEDYDLFFGGQLQLHRGPHSLFANPRFKDTASGDLHLRRSSPAVDRGTALGYARDFEGHRVPLDGDGDGLATVDLGAFER